MKFDIWYFLQSLTFAVLGLVVGYLPFRAMEVIRGRVR